MVISKAELLAGWLLASLAHALLMNTSRFLTPPAVPAHPTASDDPQHNYPGLLALLQILLTSLACSGFTIACFWPIVHCGRAAAAAVSRKTCRKNNCSLARPSLLKHQHTTEAGKEGPGLQQCSKQLQLHGWQEQMEEGQQQRQQQQQGNCSMPQTVCSNKPSQSAGAFSNSCCSSTCRGCISCQDAVPATAAAAASAASAAAAATAAAAAAAAVDTIECSMGPQAVRKGQPSVPEVLCVPGSSPADTIDVWVLAGQSNCVGWNQADGQPMPEAAAPWPGRILSFNNRSGSWQDAVPNVHLHVYGYEDADSCGPDMAFARTLIQTGTSHRVGLVPTACGGTNLFDQWAPGKVLWTNMIHDTQTALCALGSRARLTGIIWIQGESDAGSLETAAAYGTNFSRWLSATRTALAAHHPQVPVLLTVMSTRQREGAFPFIDVVAAEQRALCLPGVLKLDMAGFEMYEDAGGQLVHITKAGCCALGTAMGYQAASCMDETLICMKHLRGSRARCCVVD